MPPRTRITKEMVVDAAFEVIRESGEQSLTARTAAAKLNCSTQPVMSHFSTIEELKKAAYRKTDQYHSEYLMNVDETKDEILSEIGLNYIRFAIEEPNLFRFLFQSGYAIENNILEMIDSPELQPVLSAFEQEPKMSTEKTKEIFLTVALFTHGYASIIANNSLEHDEELIKSHLETVYKGALLVAMEEKQ